MQTRITDVGPTGMLPRGAYSPTATYTLNHVVLYNHDSWVCKAMDEQGEAIEISGIAPADNSQYWQALTDGGRAAVAVGEQVRTDFDDWFGSTVNAGIRKTVNDWLSSVQDAWTAWFSDTLVTGVRKIWATWFGGVQGEWETLSDNVTTATGAANDAAENARVRADYAQTQGNYAKQKGDEASLVDANLNGNILTVNNRNGSSKSLNVKGEKGEKGDGIDYSTLTPAEKQALVEQVSEEIAQQQGYVLYPIEEGSITPTSMFRKNSIISINGVIYLAKQDTYNLPLTFVIEGEQFVVQTLYGRTAFVAASNTVSNDWTVWADASNDIRFRQLEDRIARLESIIK